MSTRPEGLTVAIVLGITVDDISQTRHRHLGWEGIKLAQPVFASDTSYGERIVLELRDSRSRPHAGIVTVKRVWSALRGVAPS